MSVFGAVQTVFSGFVSGSSNNSKTTLNTAIGDLIIIGLTKSGGGNSAETASDTAGNTYTAIPQNYDAGQGISIQWFYCLSATHASATNTFITSRTSNPAVVQLVWDIALTGSVSLDVSTALGSGGTGPTNSSDSFTTTGTDEFVTAMAGGNGGGANTLSAGAGYTLDGTDAFINYGVGEHQVFSSTQTGITATFTSNPGYYFDVSVIAIKQGAAPPPASANQPIVIIMG